MIVVFVQIIESWIDISSSNDDVIHEITSSSSSPLSVMEADQDEWRARFLASGGFATLNNTAERLMKQIMGDEPVKAVPH